ncbi:MAG: OB-fold protein, partial [Thermodesulfobacteriota bacterium]
LCASLEDTFRSNDEYAAKQIQETPPTFISAEHLLSLYEDNELRADSQYLGQVLVVTGKLHSVKMDQLTNRIAVELIADKRGFKTVKCYCPLGKGAELIRYNKGDQLSLIGLNVGKGMTELNWRGITMWGCLVSKSPLEN